MTESGRDYDEIAAELYKRGMVEPEIAEETATHRGKPVYNGFFGVHKEWEDSGGRQHRVLRLVVNSMPTNAFTRERKRAWLNEDNFDKRITR